MEVHKGLEPFSDVLCDLCDIFTHTSSLIVSMSDVPVIYYVRVLSHKFGSPCSPSLCLWQRSRGLALPWSPLGAPLSSHPVMGKVELVVNDLYCSTSRENPFWTFWQFLNSWTVLTLNLKLWEYLKQFLERELGLNHIILMSYIVCYSFSSIVIFHTQGSIKHRIYGLPGGFMMWWRTSVLNIRVLLRDFEKSWFCVVQFLVTRTYSLVLDPPIQLQATPLTTSLHVLVSGCNCQTDTFI